MSDYKTGVKKVEYTFHHPKNLTMRYVIFSDTSSKETLINAIRLQPHKDPEGVIKMFAREPNSKV